MIKLLLLLGVAICCHESTAFMPISSLAARGITTEQHSSIDGDIGTTSRRTFMENVASTSIGISLATLLSSSSPAYASGGATAGGAYLLSGEDTEYTDTYRIPSDNIYITELMHFSPNTLLLFTLLQNLNLHLV